MKILMISAEYSALAKTGGLADAAAGLSRALTRRGHDVRVLLPGYAGLPPAGWAARGVSAPSSRRGEPAAGAAAQAADSAARPAAAAADKSALGVESQFLEIRNREDGPRIYLLAAPEFTDIAEIYTGDDRDAARFMRLCHGALQLPSALDWRPDILHCHDWHTALVPALLRGTHDAPESLAAARCVLTLHNIGYQGVFSASVLAPNGFGNLEPLLEDEERANGSVVFLKLGIRHADAVTTVSPTYAREIRTPEHGMALEKLLRERSPDLSGILNGVDYAMWGPETDPYLEHRYARTEPDGKRRVKASLCAALQIESVDAPLIGVVTRLVPQKGIDLLVGALPTLLADTNASFVLLGSGDPALEASLEGFAARYPGRISFTRGYDEALAHRIVAGSDMLLVPSRYEPCGLTQMYALRYGTIPVVRATGGLADTIEHFDAAAGTGNGSVFEHADVQGLIWGVRTAIGWHAEPDLWRRVMDNAMRADFSWEQQAQPYEALYDRLLSRSPTRASSGAPSGRADSGNAEARS